MIEKNRLLCIPGLMSEICRKPDDSHCFAACMGDCRAAMHITACALKVPKPMGLHLFKQVLLEML
jgi:hypothetical protein